MKSMGLLPASIDSIIRPRGSIFFGWWIVACSSGIQFMSGLMWMHSYGAYVALLQDEFGWSNAVVAGAFALTRVESGLLGPLQGWLTDRYGPRRILLIGNSVLGVSFLCFAFVDSILSFYLVFIFIAIGGSLGGFATLMVSIVHWFDKHRSKAITGSQLGFSMGGLAIPALVFMLELLGWRTTAFLSGLLILAITLPLSLCIRHRPAEYGLVPDGGANLSLADLSIDDAKYSNFTAREALRTKAFWLISLGHAFALLTVSTAIVHVVPYLKLSLAFTLPQAGAIVSLMTACQIMGQFAGAYCGDRFDKRVLCSGCLLAHAAAMLALAFAQTYVGVIMFAVCHGLAWGFRAPLIVALRADYFGAQFFGTILGYSSMVTMIGMSIGPIVVGLTADLTGSFVYGFCVIAGFCALGSLFFFLAKKPRSRHSPEAIRERWQYARSKLERKRLTSQRQERLS